MLNIFVTCKKESFRSDFNNKNFAFVTLKVPRQKLHIKLIECIMSIIILSKNYYYPTFNKSKTVQSMKIVDF